MQHRASGEVWGMREVCGQLVQGWDQGGPHGSELCFHGVTPCSATAAWLCRDRGAGCFALVASRREAGAWVR